MRSLGERLNLLRKLINVRCGPGAAILPKEVTRIHLDFARKADKGHMGARKFWIENLPRLKYHNPSTPIIINRHTNNDQPPKLSIYLRKPSTTTSSSSTSPDASIKAAPKRSQAASSRDNLSPPPAPDADERLVAVDATNKHSSYLLEMLLAETRAVVISPTREEVREMQALQAMSQQAEVDRDRVKQKRAEEKREEEMLKRARAAGGMAEQEA